LKKKNIRAEKARYLPLYGGFYKHLVTFINTANSLRKMIPKQGKAVARHVKTDLRLTLFGVIQQSFSDLQTFALG
jgi:hypothetical protein